MLLPVLRLIFPLIGFTLQQGIILNMVIYLDKKCHMSYFQQSKKKKSIGRLNVGSVSSWKHHQSTSNGFNVMSWTQTWAFSSRIWSLSRCDSFVESCNAFNASSRWICACRASVSARAMWLRTWFWNTSNWIELNNQLGKWSRETYSLSCRFSKDRDRVRKAGSVLLSVSHELDKACQLTWIQEIISRD